MLNELRRGAVERTAGACRQAPARADVPICIGLRSTGHEKLSDRTQGPPACTCCAHAGTTRSRASHSRPASITLDYLDLYGLRPSLDRVNSRGITARVASPRVLKPGEAAHRQISC